MRIVDRKTFLAMPSGTVYQKFSETNHSSADSLDIKGTTLNDNDWYYVSLTSELVVASHNSSDLYNKLKAMCYEDAEHPYGPWAARDECFDDDELFLIYDQTAIQQLITKLQQTLTPQEPNGQETPRTDPARVLDQTADAETEAQS